MDGPSTNCLQVVTHSYTGSLYQKREEEVWGGQKEEFLPACHPLTHSPLGDVRDDRRAILVRGVDFGKRFDKVNITFRSSPSQPVASKL